jgi:transcriptional regulator with XRE-family HTH domain
MAEGLNLSLNTYKKIEYGEKIPTVEEIKSIASTLNIDPGIFLKDDHFSIINNGDNYTGIGHVIMNDKELILALTQTLDRLTRVLEKIESK